MESLWTGFDGKDKENIESTDVVKLFDYKSNVNKFKSLLNKISLLYYDFWLALFSNNCEGKEEFKTLNDIGSKIHRLLVPIEQSFNNIYCIKNDDIEILKLYTGYIKNILNDDKKFEKFHNILSNTSTEFIFETSQIDYSSFDINNLHNEKKEVEYFIIGASDKDINERKIINMSIGLSTILGYQRHELLYKDFNILIPKIFHKPHNSMMSELTNKIKMNLYETLSNELKYTPEILSRNVYFITKTNFLKPLEFKAYLVQTEDGEHIYIVDIVRSSSFPTSWNELGEEPACCVLTDKNFIIQSFTADCCDALGLNTNLINSNFEITSCIVQFNEDILNNFNIKYKSNLEIDINDIDLKNKLIKIYNKKLDYDIKMCATSIGPHKDDIEFYLNDKNLKYYGSQGQQRIAILSLKLSEIEIFKKYKETTPILLLDDIFSELDDIKKNNLLKYINKNIQTIITTTDLNNIDKKLIKKSKIFKIESGKIEKIKEVNLNE